MVALDTLKGINKNLGMVQNEISTGKSINSSKDNAAIWSISTVMETDVAGFEQISNSLNLGSATVGVARNATENIVGYLQDAKDLIISAQEGNVDRGTIQTEIDEIVKQIGSTVNAAQFNGSNLLSSGGNIEILSSLDRAADGSVTASKITVNRQDLSETAAVTGTLSGDGAATFAGSGLDGSGSAISGVTAITIAATTDGEGNTYNFTVGGEAITYTAGAGEDEDAIASGINDAITDAGVAGLTTAVSNNEITFSGAADFSLSATSQTEVTTAGGALEGLSALSVTDDASAASALTDIEGFLSSAIDAAAQFGSKQGRIDSQIDFVSSLGDSLKAGISTLVDANLEEASARLQALQVQQQLGVQALSIANQAPQSLLSLFR
jgi:flagellin